MTKVKLRKKTISGNRESLYLDFYPPIPNTKTGNPTRREFLNLFLFSETILKDGKPKKIKLNPFDKQHNKKTLELAEQIKQKRENRLSKPEIYTDEENEKLRVKELGERSFIEYFKQLTDKRKQQTNFTWETTLKYIEKFTNEKLKFTDLTDRFCNDFKDYLLRTTSIRSKKATLAQNTAVNYFNTFKTAIKRAYKDGYLQTDLNRNIETIKPMETQRNFLTIEELNQLIKAECRDPLMKKAALFSALTGLRFSDIEKLVWGELEYIEGQGYFIQFTQKKTSGVEMMPISEQAYNLLGERKAPHLKVLDGLHYSAFHNYFLSLWIARAGITKNITFHCFRHSYAVLQLSKGTDIYTVSKMLGHRDLKTTQIYAKVMDKAKREAADKIQLNF